LNWTGGSGFSVATIFVFNGLLVTPPLSSYAYILCNADPSSERHGPIRDSQPASTNGYGTTTKPGVNISIAGIPEATFSVAGSPGIDAAIFSVLYRPARWRRFSNCGVGLSWSHAGTLLPGARPTAVSQSIRSAALVWLPLDVHCREIPLLLIQP